MIIDPKRSIDLRWLLKSGAKFISDDLVTTFFLVSHQNIKTFQLSYSAVLAPGVLEKVQPHAALSIAVSVTTILWWTIEIKMKVKVPRMFHPTFAFQKLSFWALWWVWKIIFKLVAIAYWKQDESESATRSIAVFFTTILLMDNWKQHCPDRSMLYDMF